MKQDIDIPVVKNVTVAVARGEEQEDWKVYLLNENTIPIENILVTSKGYGEKNGEKQQTSILRHFLDILGPNSSFMIEPIREEVFHLNNEYWVSYYIDQKVYDKKFIFVPDSITENHVHYIALLNMKGVLHS